MYSLLRKHPFKVLAMISAAFYVPVYILTYELGAETDGALRLMILSIPMWAVIYWVPDQLCLFFNDGKRFAGQLPLSISAGVLVCIFADRLLNKIKKRRIQKDTSSSV